MRFSSLTLTILFLLLSLKGQSQSYELGKVTIAELQEKSNPKDTAAPAAILFKKGRTFFTYNKDVGFSANHVYEFKIKIYKKKALNGPIKKCAFILVMKI